MDMDMDIDIDIDIDIEKTSVPGPASLDARPTKRTNP